MRKTIPFSLLLSLIALLNPNLGILSLVNQENYDSNNQSVYLSLYQINVASFVFKESTRQTDTKNENGLDPVIGLPSNFLKTNLSSYYQKDLLTKKAHYQKLYNHRFSGLSPPSQKL